MSLFCLLGGITISSQDTEFSQFDKVPLMQNPANTGMGKGYNRLNLTYHSQQPTIGNIYKTMYASLDAPIFSHKMKRKSGLFGAGLNFYNNTEGDSKLSTMMVGLNLAAHVNFDYYNRGSAGIQGAFVQNSYSVNNIQWDNQHNGILYDPSLPTGENFSGNSVIAINMSAGVLWQHYSSQTNLSGIDKGSFQLGYGVFNINTPSISLLGNTDKLYMRHVAHGNALIAIGEKHIGIAPSGYFMKQGPQYEYSIGTAFLYYMKADTKYTGFIKEAYVGMALHYRNTDAIIPTLIFKISDFVLGLSYDYSIGKINSLNKGVGGFEISIQFNDTYGTILNQGNKHVINSSSGQSKL